jgi:hypothetical protein
MKKDSKELHFEIKARLIAKLPEFYCSVKHNLFLGLDADWKALIVQIPSLHPEINPDDSAFFEKLSVIHTVHMPYAIKPKSLLNRKLSPISRTIRNYQFTKFEHDNLKTLFYPEINPRVNEYFGSILKRILKKVGYTVTIELSDSYFSSSQGDSSAVQSKPVQQMPVEAEAERIGHKAMVPYESVCHEIIIYSPNREPLVRPCQDNR